MKKIKTDKKEGGKQRGKLLEGAFIGAVLGVTAGILLASESGKKIRMDIKKRSGDFYRYMAPQMKKLKRLSEAEYDAFVAKGAKNYANAKRISLAEKRRLIKEAKRSWGHMKRQVG